MTNQDFNNSDGSIARDGGSSTKTIKSAATEALTMASGAAREAGTKAQQIASDAASSVNEQVREMLDKQIGESWNFAGQIASSFKVAADDLSQKSPFAAGLVRNLAEKVETYAEEFQDQTVEQVFRSAADFTRRQPAVVFGLAALAGFLILRTAKTAHVASPSISPDRNLKSALYHD